MLKSPSIVKIESLSHEGRGVAYVEGKTTFVEGALPGEEVEIIYLRKRSQYDEAKVTKIIKSATSRVHPKCPHFGICGGCSLQHLEHRQQIHHKEKVLLQHLQCVGLVPKEVLPPISSSPWAYRRRARLGVKYVAKKNKVLLGFHERNGRYIADIQSCAILHPHVGEKIILLTELISNLSIYKQIPQIEIACGDVVIAIVIRCLSSPLEHDLAKLRLFSKQHVWQIHLQNKGLESIEMLCDPIGQKLSYKLAKYNIELLFAPADFVQINGEINAKMADLISELLEPTMKDSLLDFFCGLGNFTLPLARLSKRIIGIDGDSSLVKRAQENAIQNCIENAFFYSADLAATRHNTIWSDGKFAKILLDPPRCGALALCKFLPSLGAEKIAYISCNPITLARDSKELVAQGYQLSHAGVLDMFPHTSHVEAIALFLR